MLGGAVFLVMALWTGGWFYLKDRLAGEIGIRLSQLQASGVQASCRDLAIAGFPFRFEVSCSPVMADTAGGVSFSLPALRSVALVYNPRHVIFEGDGPAHFSSLPLAFEATLDWGTGRASGKYDRAGLKSADFAFDQPSWSVDGDGFLAEANARHLELHLREVPDGSGAAEAFLSVEQASSRFAAALPAPLDIRLHLVLPRGAALLKGAPLARSSGDWSLPVHVEEFSLVSGSLRAEAKGDLTFDSDGLLSGSLQARLTDLDGFAALLAALMPEGSPMPVTLKGAATAFGKAETREDGQQVVLLPLTLSKGRVSLGLVPLGHVPPLRP